MLEKMALDIIKERGRRLLQPLLDFMPEWIEENYPKGDKDRGKITVAITLFLLDCERPRKVKK